MFFLTNGFTISDMNLLNNKGLLNYTVIKPETKSERIDFAIEELVGFIYEASGCRIAVSDSEFENNAIFLKITNENNDGYRIYTDNANVYVFGNNEHGLIYGVYALLKKIVGLNFFSPTVYDIKKSKDLSFEDFDITKIPDISLRSAGIAPVHSEETGDPILKEAFRMGLRGMSDGWGLTGHSHFVILPPEKYKALHPDWYSNTDDGASLCLSNYEMRDEFAKNLIEIVENNKDASYFMIGQPDNVTICNCDNCKKMLEKYQGCLSMIMIDFTNYVVEKVNSYFDCKREKRELQFVMFAYQRYIYPPVKFVDGKVVNLFDVKLCDNLSVMIAPLTSRGDISYFDNRNRLSLDKKYITDKSVNISDVLSGWRAISKKVFFWSYNVDYVNYLVPFDSFSSMSENYKGYKKLGVYYLFEEGAYQKYVPNFNALRLFLASRLSWDCDADINKLINEFFVGYYGEKSAPFMLRYFNAINGYLQDLVKKTGRPLFYIRFDDFKDLHNKEFWSQEILDNCFSLIKNALSLSSGDFYTRIKEEGCPIYWLYLTLDFRFNEEDGNFMKQALIETIEKYNIMGDGEGLQTGTIKNILAKKSSL